MVRMHLYCLRSSYAPVCLCLQNVSGSFRLGSKWRSLRIEKPSPPARPVRTRTVDIYLKWRDRCDTRRPSITATCTGKLIPRTMLLPPKFFYAVTTGTILAAKIAKIRLTLTKTTSKPQQQQIHPDHGIDVLLCNCR